MRRKKKKKKWSRPLLPWVQIKAASLIFIKNYYKIYIESENKMNTEELGYYLFMDSEELKRKEKEEGLTEEEKVNLEINPFFVAERRTKDRQKK